jgi:translation initiation factor IF-3
LQRRRRKPFKRAEPQFKFRTNLYIRVPEVRLVGENVEQGIYSREEAMRIATDQGLDLVEISPKADPPVCRVVEYKKFLYEKKKKEKEIKSKAQKTVLKEIRFTPNTDEHDFDFKAKHAEKFLLEGAKVKAYVHFKGRAIVFKDRGQVLLLKLAQRLEEFGLPESLPKLEGRRMIMFLTPKKK